MIEPKNNFQIVYDDKTSLYEVASWLSQPAQANLLQLANKMALARDTSLSIPIGNTELSVTRSNSNLSVSSGTEETEHVIKQLDRTNLKIYSSYIFFITRHCTLYSIES